MKGFVLVSIPESCLDRLVCVGELRIHQKDEEMNIQPREVKIVDKKRKERGNEADGEEGRLASTD